ncbi:hypothetical protein QBC43DRAFT_304545 [Cladorrhinum sp. PSN259]|nr:hypothetical protein QBC43DRAFT_304545 [Cladorrhinum sp. PSN259]
MPLSGSEAGTVIREFMTLLDSATINVWALFDAAPCKRYQAPIGNDDGVDVYDKQIGQRQLSTVCSALSKVSADVAMAVSSMERLSKARGLPAQMYMDPLQEAVEDAKVKIGTVEDALKGSSGC